MKKKRLQLLTFFCSISLFAQDPCPGNWLSTQGNQLVDSFGTVVKLSGVNWFGFETNLNNPHGLWGGTRDHKSVLQQIKDLGFNCIRVPWHNRMLEPGASLNIVAGGTDPYTGATPMNQEESQFTQPIQLLDRMVQWCQDNDMKIILDCHSRNPDAFITELRWYTSDFTEQQWIDDWVFLANRYRDFDTVIAMDINNEPHGAIDDPEGAKWGTNNPVNDWRLAAQACGNAIHAVNPDVLIIVEGIEAYQKPDGTNTSYWWGGNLQGVRDTPVVLNTPNKLVYSPHEYGPEVFNQPWFSDPNFPNNLAPLWEEQFNFINTAGTAPLFVGEFGIKEQGGVKEQWFSTFTNYISTQNLSYTFWCLNPNSGDTGGILADDWVTVNQWKMDYLEPILFDLIPNCSALSVEDYSLSNQITVYPNPADDVLIINTKKIPDTIIIYDLKGRLIMNKKRIDSDFEHTLNIADFKSGLYLIQVRINERTHTTKFIKK